MFIYFNIKYTIIRSFCKYPFIRKYFTNYFHLHICKTFFNHLQNIYKMFAIYKRVFLSGK